MYALSHLCSAAKPQKINTVADCDRFTLAILTDVLVAVTMVIVAILAIIGYTAQVSALLPLHPLYPIGAYTLLGIACGFMISNLIVYLIRKKEKGLKKSHSSSSELIDLPFDQRDQNSNATLAQPLPKPSEFELSKIVNLPEPLTKIVPDPQTGIKSEIYHPDHSILADTPKSSVISVQSPNASVEKNFIFNSLNKADSPSIDQLPQLWQQLQYYLKLTPKEQQTAAALTDWFWDKMRNTQDSEYCLKTLIPAYIALHFDVHVENVSKVVFDSEGHLSKTGVLACLSLLDIVIDGQKKADSTYLLEIEQALKQLIHKEFEKKYGSLDDQSYSPISMSNWEEIPLQNLLILSDGCFYDIRSNSSDVVYLEKEMGPGGSKTAPTKRTKFIVSDCYLFRKKLKYLNFAKKDTVQILETNFSTPPPYELLLDLCYSLLKNNFFEEAQIAYISYMEYANHPFVLALTLSILDPFSYDHHLFDMPMSECQDILRRAFCGDRKSISLILVLRKSIAIGLWNALKQTNNNLPPPSATLRNAANTIGARLL